MIRNLPSREARDAGFMLVGVAMFVLVLTILGLSLFSLSSFESQFYLRSLHQTEAFNAAAGGIERARFALIAQDSLQVVQVNLPDGVDSTLAVQGDLGAGPTSGPIGNGDIWVRVRAHSHEATSVLLARFKLGGLDKVYNRLITTGYDLKLVRTPVDVVSDAKIPGARAHTYLSGTVMQLAGTDTSWNTPSPPSLAFASVPFRNPVQFRDSTTSPDVDSYISAHTVGATLLPTPTGTYNLDAGAIGSVKFFLSTPGTGIFEDLTGAPTIAIRGTVVWMVQGALQFDSTLKVISLTGKDRLIIVAKGNSEVSPTMEFDNGVNSSVPMVLAAFGDVIFDSKGSATNTKVDSLSIFATRTEFTGPASGATMQLNHLPYTLTPNQADSWTDDLVAKDLLPRPTSKGRSTLSLVPGTWQNLSASN
ncbi:MAG: hypothetical protein HY076_01785 [Candidatus Eisenbacteria bacterium]|uniref:Uncharacterized protein n=1 Tax=Eiseniibacteriota bacterium TaxID=2212470 RepID=A0A9D6QLT0_UNCEI|nr:hypothetical protein [Candidatus Eisenbacteria bacterium]MBI3538988.1 hypothetical protein [Candidatus Eisenbacteria bacterium]